MSECPKAFYCLPESCGDCPHDEQAMMTYCDTCNQQTVESVSSRRYSHEDMHDAEQRAFMAGHAEGERAATERMQPIVDDYLRQAKNHERHRDAGGILNLAEQTMVNIAARYREGRA